jgi:hypothetical protein
MTKSPRAVGRAALRLAQESLPAYSSKFSRRDFTQHQLFAVLALKTFLKTDYRGVVRHLAKCPTSSSRPSVHSGRPFVPDGCC